MRFYRTLLQKAYFDKGFSLTNQFKYILVLFGWATDDVKKTIIVGVVWAFSCWLLGRWWFRKRLIDTEKEIDNFFNPFQREVRNYINTKSLKRRSD